MNDRNYRTSENRDLNRRYNRDVNHINSHLEIQNYHPRYGYENRRNSNYTSRFDFFYYEEGDRNNLVHQPYSIYSNDHPNSESHPISSLRFSNRNSLEEGNSNQNFRNPYARHLSSNYNFEGNNRYRDDLSHRNSRNHDDVPKYMDN